MADPKVSLTLETIDKGSSNAVGFAKKVYAGWKDLATPLNQTIQLLGQAQQAAQAAWATLSEGAALSRAESQFDNLTESIGTTAAALDQRLDEATAGMLSHAERVRSASDIISLGLADSEDGVVRLASVVSELGLDMSQVILTFANDSKMRLDALGLSVEDVDKRTQKFVETGMKMEQAFDLAVLEALEDRVLLLGPAALTAEGKLRRLEAVFKDIQDESKIGLAEGFVEGLDVSGLTAEFGNAAEAARQIGENLGRVAGETLPKVIEGASKLRDLLTSEDFQATIRVVFAGPQAQAGAVEEAAKTASEAYEREMKARFAVMTGRIDPAPIINTDLDWDQRAVEAADQYLAAMEREFANRQGAIDVQVATNQAQLASAMEAGRLMGAAMQEGLDAEASRWSVDEMAVLNAAKETAALAGAAMQAGMDAEANRYAPALWNQAQAIDQARADARDLADAAAEEAAKAYQERVSSLGDSFTIAVQGDANLDNAKEINQSLYEQADAAGASASALALLGVATGQFTEEQAEAALKTAALQEKIGLLGQAIAEGMDIGTALTDLQDFQTELEGLTFDFEPEIKLPENLPRDIKKLMDMEGVGGDATTIKQEVDVGIVLDTKTADGDLDKFIKGTYDDITIMVMSDTEQAATDIQDFIADSVEVYTEAEYQIVVTAEVGQAISALDTVKAMIAGIDRSIEITVTANTEQFDNAIDRIT